MEQLKLSAIKLDSRFTTSAQMIKLMGHFEVCIIYFARLLLYVQRKSLALFVVPDSGLKRIQRNNFEQIDRNTYRSKS